MNRKSSERLFERLEGRDLLSVNQVIGTTVFGESSQFRFKHATEGRIFVETAGDAAVLDIETNTLRPLLDFTQSDFTMVDSWPFRDQDRNNPLLRANQSDTYFTTVDAAGNSQLWVTSGTEASTQQLLQSDAQILMDQAATDDPYVFFSVGEETWVTQGTEETTRRFADANTSVLGQITDPNGVGLFLVFRFTDDAHEFWLQNPSVPDDDRLLFAASNGTFVNSHGPERSVEVHHIVRDDVYFSVGRFVDGRLSHELFVTNVSTGSTESLVPPISNWARSRFHFEEFVEVGDRILFQETGISAAGMVESRHWISGGTRDTTFAMSIEPNARLFVANDRVFYFSPLDGDLWTLDPGAIEPRLLWQNTDQVRIVAIQSASLGSGVLLGNSNVMIRTDGTVAGTSVVDEIGESLIELPDRVLSFDDTSVHLFKQGQSPSRLTLISPEERILYVGQSNNAAIYVVRSGRVGTQAQVKVYTTNGTQSGTYLLESFEALGSVQSDFYSTSEAGYFVGPFGENRRAIWQVDYAVIADVNGDARLDALDIDSLAVAISSNTKEAKFDMNRDGDVDAVDTRIWIQDAAETRRGDANLDRRVDFKDFLQLSANFQRTGDVGWADGDFNGDGTVDRGDFDDLVANFGYDRFANETTDTR